MEFIRMLKNADIIENFNSSDIPFFRDLNISEASNLPGSFVSNESRSYCISIAKRLESFFSSDREMCPSLFSQVSEFPAQVNLPSSWGKRPPLFQFLRI